MTIRSKSRAISRIVNKIQLDNNTYNSIKLYAKESDIETILNKKDSKDKEFLGLFPLDHKQIRKNELYKVSEATLEREAIWCYSIVKKYSEEIKKYLMNKEQFECFFFSGNNDEALSILDDIDNEVCISDWSIEKRAMLLYNKNYDDFKSYKKKVLKDVGGITRTIASFNIIRIEQGLSIWNFHDYFEEFRAKFELESPEFIDYFYYKVNFFNNIGQYNEARLLQYENSSSIIDRYETLLFVLQHLCCNTNECTRPYWVENMVLNIYELTGDRRLLNLLLYFGRVENVTLTNKDIEYCEVIDLYSNERYDDAREKSKVLLKKHPNMFDYCKIYIMSSIYSNQTIEHIFPETSIAQVALINVYNILAKNTVSDKSIACLKTLYFALGNMCWSSKCSIFINNETSLYTPRFRYRLFSAINDTVLYPRVIKYITDATILTSIIKSQIYDICYNVRLLVYLQSKCINADIGVDFTLSNSFREKITYAQMLKSNGNYDKSYDIYSEIANNENFTDILQIEHNEIKLTHGIMRCLTNLNRHNEAISIVTEKILKNRAYATKLRFSKLIEYVTNTSNNDDADVRSNIYTPIYLNIYASKDEIQWGALDNYMSSIDITRPLQLLEKLDFSIYNIQIIYIFKKTCIKEVLIRSIQYDSFVEVLEERIEILKELCKLDFPNKDKYEIEINELILYSVIANAKKHVEGGKISVNLKGLQEDTKFDIIKEEFEIIRRNIETEKTIEGGPYYVILLKQFRTYFKKIADLFVLNGDYGLDISLGTRIRHGRIEGTLRTVFENHNLITRIDSKSGEYIDNQYWGTISNDYKNKLSIFSMNIDNTILCLKNIKLRPKSSLYADGLFDYNFSEEELKLLFESIRTDDKYEVNFDFFFDKIIAQLLKRTEENLEVVREYIFNEITHRVTDELDSLHNVIFNQKIKQSIALCKIELQSVISEIVGWFNICKNTNPDPFNLEIPISICHETYSKGIKLDLEKFPYAIKGCYLSAFVDIFSILFDNAKKHSKLDAEDILMTIRVIEQATTLEIIVENNLFKQIDIKELNDNIQQCMKMHNKLSQEDKNSGLARIRKIMSKDMQLQESNITIPKIDSKYTIQINILMDKSILL